MMTHMRTRTLSLRVAAVAVTAVACLVAPVGGTAGAATKSGAGCRKDATPGVTTQHLSVAGADRQYLLSIPESYDASKRAPLILNFHGLGSNKEEQAIYSGMNQKAGAQGYVVITPDGSGGDLKRWAFPPLPGAGADVDFVKALLAATARTLCIDTKRVYATGMSNGAIFSTALACALPGRFAAVAPVAGVNGTKVCTAGTRRTPVLAFHGTADPIVPYSGGRYFAGAHPTDAVDPTTTTTARGRASDPLRAQPVDEAVANWAAFDGCGTPATTSSVASGVEHLVYPHCPAEGTVELYRVIGGGHTWPGAFPVNVARLGPTTSAIDATALMLEFFAAHSR
jgi:polyhydroxybutyrate depolymerase